MILSSLSEVFVSGLKFTIRIVFRSYIELKVYVYLYKQSDLNF